MSRTKKDRPWRIRMAEGEHIPVCPGCPWCGKGEEAKTEARVKRRQDDRRSIEEQTESASHYHHRAHYSGHHDHHRELGCPWCEWRAGYLSARAREQGDEKWQQ